MTPRILRALWCIAVISVCALAPNARAADLPIVGTWQLTGYSQELLETNAVTTPFGMNPTGYIQYSPGGHVVVCITAGDISHPATPSYTDAERAAIFGKIIGAYAGTYSVDGNKVTHHILTSWRPEWIGGDQTRFYELADKTLTIKTAPIKSFLSGKDIISTLIFVRVE